MIAHRELNRFFEAQKDAASAHIRRRRTKRLLALAHLDGRSGFDQETHFYSSVRPIGFHDSLPHFANHHLQPKLFLSIFLMHTTLLWFPRLTVSSSAAH
jgi:hypothetical protein